MKRKEEGHREKGTKYVTREKGKADRNEKNKEKRKRQEQ